MGKFYKQINGEWFSAINIHNKDYNLVSENKNDYKLPIDGWNWYDISPISKTEFELWELRMDAILSLKNQGKECVLELPISDFYTDSQNEISEFINNGSDVFLNIAVNSKLTWLDMKTAPSNPSPREVIIDLIEPLIINL